MLLDSVGCQGDDVYLLTKDMAGYVTKVENEDVVHVVIYINFTIYLLNANKTLTII